MFFIGFLRLRGERGRAVVGNILPIMHYPAWLGGLLAPLAERCAYPKVVKSI